MSKGEHEWPQAVMQSLIRIVLGSAAALAACILLLMLAALWVSIGWLEEVWMDRLTAAACAAGAFIGAVITGKRNKNINRLLHGILVGAVLFAFMLIIGTTVYSVTALGREDMLLLGSCLCGGGLSGLLLRKPKAKGKRIAESRGKRRRR